MTATLRTILALPGGAAHESTLSLPASPTTGRWRKLYAALRAGGEPTAQHSIGWHVYARRWAGGAYELAVRWSGGLIRKNGTGFVGRVFFDSLAVEIGGDENLFLVPEARAGAFYEATRGVHFIAHGGGHVFPPHGILERRFLAVPRSWTSTQVSDLVERALRFKATRFPAPGAKPWGPARERHPAVNRTHYGNLYRQGAANARNLLASGAPGSVRLGPSGTWANLDRRFAAMGPWMPDGDPQAGAPAGYEIELAFGWPQVPEALELSAMAHECSMARNAVAMNDLDTGEQISVHDWPTAAIGQPQLLAGEPGAQQGRLEIPAFTVGGYPSYRYPNFNQGACAYLAGLEGYADDDTEHLVRALDDAAFLAFTAGDPMAQDDLRALMEYHRHMRWSDRADEPGPGAGSWLKSTTRLYQELQAKPHKGHSAFLRSFGWITTSAVLAQESSFLRKLVDCYLLAYDTCGIAQREFHEPYLPPGIQGTQHFHNAIDQAAVLRGVRFLADPVLTDRVLDAIRLWAEKVVLNPQCKGPAKWIHRQRADGSEVDPITVADHGPEVMSEHTLAVLGLAALCAIEAGDRALATFFLDAGLKVDVPHSTLDQRLAWIKSKTADLSQYASYQSAIEALENA